MDWPHNIKTLTGDELKAWLREQDEKPFRADQIQKWLFCQQVKTYDEMVNISPALREKLPLRKSDWHKEYLDWAIPAFRLVHAKVPQENVWVNPDCGLKTRGETETTASLKNLVAAAKKLRNEK